MIVAAVLAAGAGTRFDGEGHKLRADLAGTSVVRRAVDAAVASGIGPVLVVTGAVGLTDLLPAGVSEIVNEGWADGQASSLALAVRAADDLGAEAVVIGLGDMAYVDPGAWREVAERPGGIVTAVYDGRRSPPVKLDRSVWPDLPTQGDEGARGLMRGRADLVVEVSVGGRAIDIDTRADLDSAAALGRSDGR